MNMLVWAVAVISSVLLESFIPASWTLGRTRAPVLLAVVLYYALCRGRGQMLAAAFVGGFLRDAFADIPLGCSAFGLVILGFILQRHREDIFGGRLMTRLTLGLVGGTAFGLVMYIAVLVAQGPPSTVPVYEAFGKALGMGVWGMAVMPLVMAALEKFETMVGNVAAPVNDIN